MTTAPLAPLRTHREVLAALLAQERANHAALLGALLQLCDRPGADPQAVALVGAAMATSSARISELRGLLAARG